MNWVEWLRNRSAMLCRNAANEMRQSLMRAAGDLQMCADTSQLNRRTRRAWRHGRQASAFYHYASHQRRRLARRHEIRRLVEG